MDILSVMLCLSPRTSICCLWADDSPEDKNKQGTVCLGKEVDVCGPL